MSTQPELPKRFTVPQVYAVFTDAGPDAPPMRTADIAKKAREAHGAKFGDWRDDVRGNTDVTKALDQLVTDGRLITSKRPAYRRPWAPGDEQHAHIVPPGNTSERYYATPKQAAVWQSRLDRLTAYGNRASTDLGTIERVIEDAVPGGPATGTVSETYGQVPTVRLSLTVDQAEFVATVLAQWQARHPGSDGGR